MDSNAICIVKIDEPTKIEIQEALKRVQEIFGASERERENTFHVSNLPDQAHVFRVHKEYT